MTKSFGSVSKRGSGRGNGNSKPAETLLLMVAGYQIKDPKGGWTPDDVVEGMLMRDTHDIKAEFDADGNPLTKVRVYLREDKKAASRKHKRESVAEFRKGNNSMAKAVVEGAIISADTCFNEGQDADGIYRFSSSWLNRHFVQPQVELHWPLAGVMTSVRPQTTRTVDGEDRHFQSRYVAMTDDAVKVASFDEVKATALQVLKAVSESAPGTAGFILRGIDLDTLESGYDEYFIGWDRDNGTFKTPEQVVEEWAASDSGQGWAEVIAQQIADNANSLVEVIPAIRVSTGMHTLPANRKDRMFGSNPVPEDKEFLIDDSVRYRVVNDEGEKEFAFVRSDVLVQRTDTDKNWSAIATWPIHSRTPMFAQSELLTPNVPEDVAVKLTERAEARRRAANPNANANANANEQEQEEAPAPGYGV